MKLQDATGSNAWQGVDCENRAKVYATTESEISHESETNKRAYSWTTSYNYDAGDTILLLKNTSSTLNLIIDKIMISSDTATKFIIHFPTGTTLAGTTITGVNSNRSSNNTPDASCYSDETGNTQGDIFGQGYVGAGGNALLPIDGAIILGVNNEIAIDFVTAGTLGMVTIRGYYHTI